MKEFDKFNDLLGDILPSNEDKKIDKLKFYLELLKKRDELDKRSSELLFKNVALGEKRGELETEIKIFQSKIHALKSTEEYLDILAEETTNRIAEISTLIRGLEAEEEIIDYLKNEKDK